MPKAATKVAIMRSVPSAGSLIVGKVFDPPSARLSAQLGAKRGDLAREFAALPSQRRLSLGLARLLRRCWRQQAPAALATPARPSPRRAASAAPRARRRPAPPDAGGAVSARE